MDKKIFCAIAPFASVACLCFLVLTGFFGNAHAFESDIDRKALQNECDEYGVYHLPPQMVKMTELTERVGGYALRVYLYPSAKALLRNMTAKALGECLLIRHEKEVMFFGKIEKVNDTGIFVTETARLEETLRLQQILEDKGWREIVRRWDLSIEHLKDR
jgi:hypothetical protein